MHGMAGLIGHAGNPVQFLGHVGVPVPYGRHRHLLRPAVVQKPDGIHRGRGGDHEGVRPLDRDGLPVGGHASSPPKQHGSTEVAARDALISFETYATLAAVTGVPFDQCPLGFM